MRRAALLPLVALVLAVGCTDDDPPTQDPWCRISGAIECPRLPGATADGGFTLDDGGTDAKGDAS